MTERTKTVEQNEKRKQNAMRISNNALYGFMKQGPAVSGPRYHWTDDLSGPPAYKMSNLRDEK
jgi:hypothetical protein